MGLINLLSNDPIVFILLAIPLLYSVIIHEVAHGWVAYRMGDSTAKLLGRLSLNPLKHLDPIGTVVLFIFGFGWAKPVPVNFENLNNRQRGLVFVSSAGIIANLLLAFTAFVLYRILLPSPSGSVAIFLYYLAQVNIVLASFNLIPIPPLDGSKILLGFASEKFQYAFARLEPFGFFIIIALLYLGLFEPIIKAFRYLILIIINIMLP